MRRTHQKSHKLHYISYIVPIILSLFILSNNTVYNASALEYQSNTNLEFTLNPTLSINVSDNLVIDKLSPGTAKDSNIVNVSVVTNNVTGYVLTATVGNTNNPTTYLTNISNSNYKFTGLESDESNLSNFNDNEWGYNYSTDNGTTWHGYSTLPLYTTTGTTLSEKYNASNDIIKFKIGAKASTTQASGTYSNTINFYATTFPDTDIKYYMHEFTNVLCQELASDNDYIVYDIRDNSDYTVRYIGGACWMTQNLRITGTISARYSNFTGADINISQKDLDASVGECTGTNCNSYIIPMTHKSNNKTDGTYYNFCATSAGTICSDNLMENASSDICPSNWQLSTAKHNFTASGFYNNGSLGAYGMYGYWWLSTAHSDDITIYARYDKVNSRIDTSRDGYRFYGFNVRCVTK